MVLHCEAGVIGNDEWYYLVCKAFLEHYEPAYVVLMSMQLLPYVVAQ